MLLYLVMGNYIEMKKNGLDILKNYKKIWVV